LCLGSYNRQQSVQQEDWFHRFIICTKDIKTRCHSEHSEESCKSVKVNCVLFHGDVKQMKQVKQEFNSYCCISMPYKNRVKQNETRY
jgi:hypothetical protein